MSESSEPAKRSSVTRFEISLSSIAAIVITIAMFWLVRALRAIIVTIMCSFILVGTLNPLVEWLERHRVKRHWAITIVFGTGAIFVGLLSLVIVPPLWEQVSQLATRMPEIQSTMASRLRMHAFTAPLANLVQNFAAGKANGANVTAALALSMSVIEGIGYGVTMLVLAMYFMADHERTRGALYAVVPREYHIRLARILLNLEPIVGGYMRGQVITSAAIGIFTFALLSLFHIHNALSLAAFAAITDIIPFVGGLLATTPAVLASLSHGITTALIIFASMVSYQEFESRIIVPRVYGRVLRLPSAVVVIALLVGGKLGGIIGALLALPLAAALLMVIKELRVELPGDDSDHVAIRERDAKAEKSYAKQSAGTSPKEASAVATQIAEQTQPSKKAHPKGH